MEHPNYYSILPANVRYSKELKANEKLLYSEISALSNKQGYCHAGDRYFADLYGVSKATINRWISHLAKLGFIKKRVYKKNNQIVSRKLWIVADPCNTPIDENVNTPSQNDHQGTDKKINTPIDENVIENITSNNITSINKTTTTTDLVKSKLSDNGILPTEATVKMVYQFLQTMEIKAVFYAIEKTGKAGQPSANYLESILKYNQKHQILAYDQAVAADEKRKRDQEPPQSSGQYIPLHIDMGVATHG